MTLKELSEHPEQASEEDRKAIEGAFEIIKEFGKRSEYILNGITMNSGRSKEELEKSYYEETMLMATVLESFIYKPVQEYNEIKKFVFNYTDNAFIWGVSLARYNLYLANYSNLAQAALFNMQTQRLNDQALELSKRAVKQNWMMLAVAITSAVAAFVSVFIAISG